MSNPRHNKPQNSGTGQIVLGALLMAWGVFVALTGTIPLIGVVMIALGVLALVFGLNARRRFFAATSAPPSRR